MYATYSKLKKCQYRKPLDHPHAYVLPTGLMAGFMNGTGGVNNSRYTKNGQIFMAQHCSLNWDGTCESMSHDRHRSINEDPLSRRFTKDTYGENLIANAIRYKYLLRVIDQQGRPVPFKMEPYDHLNYHAPAIHIYNGGIPVYHVKNPELLDEDPLMRKLLRDPSLAPDVLDGIARTTIRVHGSLDFLKGTRLYDYYHGRH